MDKSFSDALYNLADDEERFRHKTLKLFIALCKNEIAISKYIERLSTDIKWMKIIIFILLTLCILHLLFYNSDN